MATNRVIGHATVLVACSFLLLNAGPTLANPACGETLSGDVTLLLNMHCPNTAIHFDGEASRNVTLDCVGRSIVVDSGSAIIATNTSGITIRNCVISTDNAYSHGILFRDGTRNSRIQDNTIFTDGFGSRGIELRQSSKNRITGNHVETRGSGSSGLRLRSGSSKNHLQHNSFQADDAMSVRIESSGKNKLFDTTFRSPVAYLAERNFALQNGGLGVDGAGNIWVVENDWGGQAGIGEATAFFRVDPNDGAPDGIMPVRKGQKHLGFGFDALEVLADDRVIASPGPGCCDAPTLYEINPANGKASPIALNVPGSVTGQLNGLDGNHAPDLLATTNQGELLNIDLDTGEVTEIGEQGTGWTGIAEHPTNGKVYAVSRRRDEASGTAHLYEIDAADGQVITPIGDTGLVNLSSIDFALTEVLYGNSGSGLVTIDTTTGAATVKGTFGPDPLEPSSYKNRLKNARFETDDGSITVTDLVTLPGKLNTSLDADLIDIRPNEAMIDAGMLPFLDAAARITLNNIPETYIDLLVDREDDGSFKICKSPRCKFVSHEMEILTFDVNGFTTYSSQENTDPSLAFISVLVMNEVKKLLKQPGLPGNARKKLKAALADLEKGTRFANRDNVKKGLVQLGKSVADLLRADKKIEGVDDLIVHLVLAAESEADDAIDAANEVGGDPALIAEAEARVLEAQDLITQSMPGAAIAAYQQAVVAALKAARNPV